MCIKDLVEQLKAVDPNAIVFASDGESSKQYREIDCVTHLGQSVVIWTLDPLVPECDAAFDSVS